MAIDKLGIDQHGTRARGGKGVRQARSSVTARRIIDAAHYLLDNNRPLSNEAIAEIANVSISSIYRYFENRSDLFTEMYRLEVEKNFDKVAAEIARMNSQNFREVVTQIIRMSAEAVEVKTFALHSTFRNISYEAAQEINIRFGHNIIARLTEQIARMMNCHPSSIDQNHVVILARMLVSIPRATIVEDEKLINRDSFFTTLADAAADILMQSFTVPAGSAAAIEPRISHAPFTG